ncbi:MAG: ABC transporter substrate-binding protein [Alphaproteobacteria bacterium]|nr:ABC transporter substrate-binding protein [Alphaproteobacteria bacterium]
MSTPLVLRIAIGNYDQVKALKDGSVTSDRLRLEFVEVDPLNRAFRMMLRDWKFDVCEMALATHAVAHRFEKPVAALPIVLHRGFHHGALHCALKSRLDGPAALSGKRIGVRSYSQTTGVWVRGILEVEYGVDPDTVTWVVDEDSHVAEYRDPPNVELVAEGKTLGGMLRSGEIDAAIGLSKIDPAEIRTVIPDADKAALGWYRKIGIYPANHAMVVKRDILAAHPWLGTELIALFEKAKTEAYRRAPPKPPSDPDRARLMAEIGADPLPYGMTANRASIEMLLGFCTRQKLTERTYRIDELFDPATLI